MHAHGQLVGARRDARELAGSSTDGLRRVSSAFNYLPDTATSSASLSLPGLDDNACY